MQDNESPAPLISFPPASPAEALSNGRRRRFLYYFASLFIGICIFALPLKDLMAMSVRSELYDYIPLMYALCGYLLVRERKEIFENPGRSWGYGAPVLIVSLVAGAAGLNYTEVLKPENYLCVMSFSFWLYLMGTFILFFGARTFVKAIFPLLMLLFTVPLPATILAEVVELLRKGSYLSASWIFHTLGFVPIERGFSFAFPQISIEVAKECSGIHACIALVIMALLFGRYFLHSRGNRLLLVICAVPIATFKNGVRIAALTLATIYIDPHILSTVWHRDGGIIIFGLGFAWLALILFAMRKLEKRKA
ncbi:MAG: exosortase/archaeosortase family protein [Deltaproteobacteria bacterium]|jgi:exosortase|nr:exosortase/archaeosortase family protein [Deltaproteobacteria bacterium]MDA8308945.1 exosortase/archaeosortase family protein [Deltaproteobacteria bacterium]